MAANQENLFFFLSGHEGGAGEIGITPDLHATFANGDVVVFEHS